MIVKEVISKFNPTNAEVAATGGALSSVGRSYQDNTDANNTNNTGLIAVKQFSGGNAASIVTVEGSIEGTKWVALVTLTQSAQTGGIASGGSGAALLNIYAGGVPPFLRMRVTGAAHTTNSDTLSGVSLFVGV
jgi:hypothetical protein